MENVFSGQPEEILEKMDEVPPIINIAKKLQIKPLPLAIEEFPPVTFTVSSPGSPTLQNEKQTQQEDGGLETQDFSVTLEENLIVDRISFTVNAGEIVALLGPNGRWEDHVASVADGLDPLYREPVAERSSCKGKHSEYDDSGAVGYLPQNPNDLLFAEDGAGRIASYPSKS